MSKSSTNKRLYALHGWLGLNFGLILFIICLSGTFAVVSREIDWLLTPAMRVTPQSSRASYGDMYAAVRREYPDAPVRVAWAPIGSRFACEFWVESESGETLRVYVDPYTGRVQGTSTWFNAQRFFRDFHRRFFLYSWWGIWVVAAFGLVLLGSAASGLAFYKRWWAKLFTLRLSKGARVFGADLHRLAGVWTLLFAVVIAVTGVWYFVELPWNWWGPPRPPSVAVSDPDPAAERPAPEPRAVDRWVRRAEDTLPELEVASIWFPSRRRDPVRVQGQATAWLVRDRANKVFLHPETGDVLSHQRAENLGWMQRWVDTADPLHFGNFGGLASKLLWFAFGLLLSILMPTGAYLAVRRRQQMALGIAKRLRTSKPPLKEREIAAVLDDATRSYSPLGLYSTSIIALLATYATWQALADQLADAGSVSSWQALGGVSVIACYGSFLALVLLASVLWYRCVWLRTLSASAAEPAPPRPERRPTAGPDGDAGAGATAARRQSRRDFA